MAKSEDKAGSCFRTLTVTQQYFVRLADACSVQSVLWYGGWSYAGDGHCITRPSLSILDSGCGAGVVNCNQLCLNPRAVMDAVCATCGGAILETGYGLWVMVRRQEDIATLKSVVQVRLGRWKRMKVITGNTWETLSFYPCPPVAHRLS